MIRNDYTFINRLKKLRQKYIEQIYVDFSSNVKMCFNIDGWIVDIKEDMRLEALQEINNRSRV
ncbi:MAG TPA: hypothetical protein GXZ90_06260 [Clostridiales bacterium]|nr:hypothetical protein [Clostridiales bacterium]